MRKSPSATKALGEEQRLKILDAATRVFAAKGLDATMDDVAVAASVSHGLAYRYFSGKEALIAAVVERAVQEGRDAIEEFLERRGSAAVRLTALFSALLQSRLERPELHLLLEHVHDSDTVPAALRESIRSQGEEVFSRMREWIVEGQSDGTVYADDPDQLLTAIGGSLRGLSRFAANSAIPFDRRGPEPSILLRMLFPSRADPC